MTYPHQITEPTKDANWCQRLVDNINEDYPESAEVQLDFVKVNKFIVMVTDEYMEYVRGYVWARCKIKAEDIAEAQRRMKKVNPNKQESGYWDGH